jgi:1,5-anhydro-D-fructose reductase (1,5-anhydro-D-mannitol-forming)
MPTISDRRRIGWGVIGASNFAATYVIPAIHAVADAEAIAVFSTSADRGARFAAACGVPRSYESIDELLGDPNVHAVYISTTNELHADQSIAAARAGKHILCEKPLALSLDDARAMQLACDEAGVVLGTNHHLRGAPTIAAMRRLVEDGAIGEILAARVFHARSLPTGLRTWRLTRPKAGAGVILDITVHDADTLRYLLADEIVEVSAIAANQGLASEGIEDSVMGVMRSASGALISFHDAFTIPHAGTGIELHGTAGSLIGRDLLMPDPVGEVLLRRDDDIQAVNIPTRWPLYENAIARFDAAVRGEGTPLASGLDGISSLACALAARESSRLDGAAVSVSRSYLEAFQRSEETLEPALRYAKNE